jgi:hypothetical protein
VSYTYQSFLSAFALNLVVPQNDINFTSMLPNAIDDAEQRIRRDLDLLANVVSDQTGVLTPNSRNFTFPQFFVVCERVNVFTPAGSTTNRVQLIPVSLEFLNAVWPNETAPSVPSVPSYYAMLTDQTIVVGPAPDAAYEVEISGTVIPPALSASNATTWISTYLPDLFMAAAMIYGAAWQQNFSALGDNPAQGMTWSQIYTQKLQSAEVEEQRKRYASQAWSAKQPAPLATPPRN